MIPTRRVWILAAAALALGGCRAVAPALGTDVQTAAATADGVLGGVSNRFITIERDPKARVARQHIARGALSPSRLFADTTAWLWSPDPSTRAIGWRGANENGKMVFRAGRNLTPPSRPGEGLHHLHLRSLGGNAFEWKADVDFGIGGATPSAVAGIPVAWIAAGERADTAAMRAEVRTAFVNSRREWGRLFTLVAIRREQDASGAWRQRHTVVLNTARASRSYPAFGKWLKDYISPVRMHLRWHRGGRTWFDFTLRYDTLTVAFRSRNGLVLPLEGGEELQPDTVTMEMEFSTRLSIFRLGFEQLRGDFITVREPGRRGWLMRFTQEPDWRLPPLAESMLRSPLRRPFILGGSTVSVIAVSKPAGPQNILARKMLVPVQDSPIMRFLGHLGNAAVEGYVDRAEDESIVWISSSFDALRDDLKRVLSGH